MRWRENWKRSSRLRRSSWPSLCRFMSQKAPIRLSSSPFVAYADALEARGVGRPISRHRAQPRQWRLLPGYVNLGGDGKGAARSSPAGRSPTASSLAGGASSPTTRADDAIGSRSRASSASLRGGGQQRAHRQGVGHCPGCRTGAGGVRLVAIVQRLIPTCAKMVITVLRSSGGHTSSS